MMEQGEKAQLDKAWTVIRIIWSALFGSLGVYLIVCKVIEDQLQPSADVPFALLRNIFTGLSAVVFLAAYVVRKAMLKRPESNAPSALAQNAPGQVGHPLAAKYLVAMLVATALSESIGVFGLVLFFLGKNTATLYQFIGTSAIAMFVYRPRKDEYLEFVTEGTRRGGPAAT